jgi:uncharacterized membrane protein YkoI
MNMNPIKALFCIVAICLFATGCATTSEAKISRAEAERVALAKVPNGVVKEGELEKEHGRLIWSFDIATPGSHNITEVHVDAMTGEIVAVEIEDEAHEKKEKEEKK